MLALSYLLMVAAVAVYVLVPSVRQHMTHPVPVYVLLLASMAAAVAARRRGVGRSLTIGLGSLLTTFVLYFTLSMSGLDRAELAVKPGDRFPDFTLETSTGAKFSPSDLLGEQAALYVFYRGDW